MQVNQHAIPVAERHTADGYHEIDGDPGDDIGLDLHREELFQPLHTIRVHPVIEVPGFFDGTACGRSSGGSKA